MFTLTTLLVLNGYLAEKQGPTEKVKQTVRIRFVYVVIFHTQISTCTSKKILKCTVTSSSSLVKNYY